MSIYRGRNKKEFYLSSLLYDSIDDRNFSAVKSLLTEKGADPNIVLPKKGISPFHLVIGCDSNDFAILVTRLILQHGGNPNVRSDDGLTPLHIAAAWGRIEILQLLLKNGGDVEARDANSLTPVYYARKEGFIECEELLRTYVHMKWNIAEEKKECEICDLTLDKIVVNNGQVIGEYEIVNECVTDSITNKPSQHFKSLPQPNKTEYVLNWFNKNIKQPGNVTFNTLPNNIENMLEAHRDSLHGLLEDSAENIEQDNMKNITVRKACKNYGNVNKNCNSLRNEIDCDKEIQLSAQNVAIKIPHVSYDCSKIITDPEQFSEESGIVTLANSIKNLSVNNEAKQEKRSNFEEPTDISNDYLSCLTHSIFEKNISHLTKDSNSLLTSDKSENSEILFDSDESKIVKNFQSYKSESEGVCSSDVTFFSISEIYKYIDKEKDIVLYEKRLLKTLSEYGENVKANSCSSKVSSLPEILDYDTDVLKKELTLRGYPPGPITNTTKKVYLKKLYQLTRYSTIICKDISLKKVYSVELEKTLHNSSWSTNLALYKPLEEGIIKQFSNPDPTRKWREGVNKSSFTYLLLDPRITNNLPCRAELLQSKEIWETFLNAIFYVGKGKRARPYSHLYEAVTLWKQQKYTSDNKKLQNILDIWKTNSGVICLHVFQNIIPVEAYTREAAMINALKTENITNIKSGDFYGIAATWPQKQRNMLGVYLLYKAMIIFLNEGERQLCPSDIQ